jgi:hypothetical protein
LKSEIAADVPSFETAMMWRAGGISMWFDRSGEFGYGSIRRSVKLGRGLAVSDIDTLEDQNHSLHLFHAMNMAESFASP